MIDISKNGNVFVLTMNAGENRFNRQSVDAINAALDEVEASSGPAAMVTTGGIEKFYCNGLDLDWMLGDGKDDAGAVVADVIRTLARLLAFPVPSVAAINGHAFAGGAMFAMAHDFRVMRSDRGYFCLPEVDLGLPLADGMTAVLQSKLQAAVLNELVLTGARVGGERCRALGIVDEVVPGDQVLERAVERAEALSGKDRRAYAALKRGLYGEAIGVAKLGVVPV
jgi:enoyl-CoA hydratase/carnithine racemase